MLTIVQGKIVAQGKLLLRGPLLCTEDPNTGPNYKFKEMTVFLFEQIMIFAETVGKKTQFTSPVYTYKAHIQVKRKDCTVEIYILFFYAQAQNNTMKKIHYKIVDHIQFFIGI
jgi:hypothetical protein